MQKFNQTLLVVSITGLLIACGGGGSSNPSPTQPNTPTTPTTPTPTNPTTPTNPSTTKSIRASLANHSVNFTWEQGESVKVNAVDQDNKSVAVKSCTSDDNQRITVAADCSAIKVHRLGESTFTVTSADNLTSKVTVIGVPTNTPLAMTSAGGNIANRIVTAEGKIMTWGSDFGSQIATKNASSVDYLQYPDYVVTADGNVLSDIYQVAHGYATAFALNGKGQVYAWGRGVNQYTVSKKPNIYYPELVLDATGNAPVSNIVKIATNQADGGALGLTDEGKVVVFGFSNPKYPQPVMNNGVPLSDIKAIALGSVGVGEGNMNFAYAVDSKGQVYSWKIDPNASSYTVNLVKDKNGNPLTGVTKVVAGSKHVLALTDKGQVYAWGESGEQLGDASIPISSQFLGYVTQVNIKGTPLANIKDIGINFSSSYAVTQSGNVYAWGFGATGELGDGPNHPLGNETATPTLVTSENGMGVLSNVVTVTSHDRGAIALKSDGSMVGWGNNWHGLLTQDNPESGKYYFTPVVIQASKGQPLKVDLSKYTQLN